MVHPSFLLSPSPLVVSASKFFSPFSSEPSLSIFPFKLPRASFSCHRASFLLYLILSSFPLFFFFPLLPSPSPLVFRPRKKSLLSSKDFFSRSEIRTSNSSSPLRRVIFSTTAATVEGDQRNDYPINRLIAFSEHYSNNWSVSISIHHHRRKQIREQIYRTNRLTPSSSYNFFHHHTLYTFRDIQDSKGNDAYRTPFSNFPIHRSIIDSNRSNRSSSNSGGKVKASRRGGARVLYARVVGVSASVVTRRQCIEQRVHTRPTWNVVRLPGVRTRPAAAAILPVFYCPVMH